MPDETGRQEFYRGHCAVVYMQPGGMFRYHVWSLTMITFDSPVIEQRAGPFSSVDAAMRRAKEAVDSWIACGKSRDAPAPEITDHPA